MDDSAQALTASDDASKPIGAKSLIALNLFAAVLGFVMAGRVYFSLTRDSRLTHESGVWLALAMDAAHGVIYRPLIGPLGYGGTRYFPLQFLLHGLLIRLGMSPIHGGYVVLIGSALLLLASMLFIFRKLGVSMWIAAPLCVLASSTGAAEMGLVMIRGDLFAAALNLAALACCVGMFARPNETETRPASRDSIRVSSAALLFALAFFSKETTVFGFLAVVAVLWLQGGPRRRLSYLMVVEYAVVIGIGILAVLLASHGNFLANLRACASGGDMKFAIQHFITHVSDILVTQDPVGFVVLLLGITTVCASPREHSGFLSALLIATAGVTLSLFLTPGIDRNHLLDVQLVCVIALGVRMSRSRQATWAYVPSLCVLMFCATGLSWVGFLRDLPFRGKMYTEFAHGATDGQAGPLLTDFSLLPILENRSPFMLDDFMMYAMCDRYPNIRADLYKKLDESYFSAVLLKADPTRAFRLRVWGPDFTKHLNKGYVAAPPKIGFLVYVRRGSHQAMPKFEAIEADD